MGDLRDFLLARLDEDAAEIAKQPDQTGEPGGIGIWSSGDAISNTEYLIISKTRALAEVEAKRQIVEEHRAEGGSCRACTTDGELEVSWDGEQEETRWVRNPVVAPCLTVRALASIYIETSSDRGN
ncbi:DUF6221 family protein [Actinomadura rudentiformis]|uniref:Uncharacterized protein n=1 Tax=Actinomadura rudentiformis TaxID=359158 RepID=A0A6H9YMV9_9ACTN|nr:DUF6221 family protein [Actinomadura rudentiformis]KAB2347332.1 hypothetical protein F8566_20180 [Actinomadura rudentiformis]